MSQGHTARRSGTELNVTALNQAVKAAINQAASVARGEIGGNRVSAYRHSAIETRNLLWEWYEATSTQLDYAIKTFEKAGGR